MVLGFKPTTFRLRVSSHYHQTRAPALGKRIVAFGISLSLFLKDILSIYVSIRHRLGSRYRSCYQRDQKNRQISIKVAKKLFH